MKKDYGINFVGLKNYFTLFFSWKEKMAFCILLKCKGVQLFYSWSMFLLISYDSSLEEVSR